MRVEIGEGLEAQLVYSYTSVSFKSLYHCGVGFRSNASILPQVGLSGLADLGSSWGIMPLHHCLRKVYDKVDMSFVDRVAVVTGASRGIGRAIAEELAAGGATVVVNYAHDADGATAVVDAITKAGGDASAFQADVSDYSAAEALIKYTVTDHGKLDVLVNNAGVTRDQVIMLMSEEDWDVVLRVNLKSAFNCCKPAVRAMMRKRYGRIVNISSVAGISGNPGQTNYSASKAGLIGFSRALAREVAPRKITVNVVAPGFVPTALTNDLPDDIKESSLAAIPLGRWGEPTEVAGAVAFLADEYAGYITGQVLNVDGGMVMA